MAKAKATTTTTTTKSKVKVTLKLAAAIVATIDTLRKALQDDPDKYLPFDKHTGYPYAVVELRDGKTVRVSRLHNHPKAAEGTLLIRDFGSTTAKMRLSRDQDEQVVFAKFWRNASTFAEVVAYYSEKLGTTVNMTAWVQQFADRLNADTPGICPAFPETHGGGGGRGPTTVNHEGLAAIMADVAKPKPRRKRK